MIRDFLSTDASAAAGLHKDCFPQEPWPEEAFTKLLESGSFGFMSEKKGEIAGLILIRAVLDEAEILTFAVAPRLRRTGVGEALLSYLCADLPHRGITRFLLEVGETNAAAINLYRKLGFSIYSERAGYYRHADHIETALLMEKSLISFQKQ